MKSDNDNKLPRSRAEAKSSGAKHYFTGKPCKHGHVDKRYTVDGQCAECARIKALARFNANKEVQSAKTRKYLRLRYATDSAYREGRIEYQRLYRSDPINDKKIKAREQRRRENRTDGERDKQREYIRDYQRTRHQRSPKARVDRSMSGGIYKSIVDGAKLGRRWESLVGYTILDLMRHLERLFQPGMCWENYGKDGWHIDHRIPKSSFNYERPEDPEFQKCWAMENLQPLWWRDNISKGAKIVGVNINHRKHHSTTGEYHLDG